MSTPDWDCEMTRYVALPSEEKWRWLSKLMFALTLLARKTYTVGEAGLDEPEKLRRFNELCHRVATQLRDIAAGRASMPGSNFVAMLTEALEELSIEHSVLLSYLTGN